MSSELTDEIYAELENALGREATFEEQEKVAERLPSVFVSKFDIRRVVARLVAIEVVKA